MASGFPLGGFFRGRRDWALPQLMFGGGGGFLSGLTYIRIALQNNSKTGNYLAVYGVIAVSNFYNKSCAYAVMNTLDPAISATLAPYMTALVGGYPALDGALGSASYTSIPNTGGGAVFWGDGSHWVSNGDTPLAVLAPGQQLGVYQSFVSDTCSSAPPLNVSFLWGYYSASKPPKVST